MGRDFQVAGETAMSSDIPLYPFAYGMGFACLVVCLVLLYEVFVNTGKLMEQWR